MNGSLAIGTCLLFLIVVSLREFLKDDLNWFALPNMYNVDTIFSGFNTLVVVVRLTRNPYHSY